MSESSSPDHPSPTGETLPLWGGPPKARFVIKTTNPPRFLCGPPGSTPRPVYGRRQIEQWTANHPEGPVRTAWWPTPPGEAGEPAPPVTVLLGGLFLLEFLLAEPSLSKGSPPPGPEGNSGAYARNFFIIDPLGVEIQRAARAAGKDFWRERAGWSLTKWFFREDPVFRWSPEGQPSLVFHFWRPEPDQPPPTEFSEPLLRENIDFQLPASLRDFLSQIKDLAGEGAGQLDFQVHPFYRRLAPTWAQSWPRLLRVFMAGPHRSDKTIRHFFPRWQRNFFRHWLGRDFPDASVLNFLPAPNPGKDRPDKAPGTGPAVLVLAGGPSLPHHWESLEPLWEKSRIPVLAVDTALPFCARMGIKPDLVFSVDAGRGTNWHFYYSLPISGEATRSVLLTWPGAAGYPIRRFGNSTRFFLTSFPWEQLLHGDFPYLGQLANPGGNILSLVLEFARHYLPGNCRLLLAGVDLEKKAMAASHFRGSAYHHFALRNRQRLRTPETALGRYRISTRYQSHFQEFSAAFRQRIWVMENPDLADKMDWNNLPPIRAEVFFQSIPPDSQWPTPDKWQRIPSARRIQWLEGLFASHRRETINQAVAEASGPTSPGKPSAHPPPGSNASATRQALGYLLKYW